MAEREIFRITATDNPDIGDMEGMHVSASVPVAGLVDVSHVAQIVGEALASILREEQWPVAAELASKLGISETEWDQFLTDCNRLMMSELFQFVDTIGRLAATPGMIFSEDGDDSATEFRIFAEWVHSTAIDRAKTMDSFEEE
jgi:hypothetical protein